MAGIRIINKDANYSALGLGNVNKSEIYISTINLTNTTQRTAIRALYNSLKTTGLDKKFKVFRLFYAGTSLADSINLMNPVTGVAANQATYVSDNASYHTASGWTPNGAAGHYAISNYLLNEDINKVHFHAWNSTTPSNSNSFLLAQQANATGNAFYIALQRKGSGPFAKGAITPYSSVFNLNAPSGYDTHTGLLSVARQAGGIMKLYDDAVEVISATRADTWSMNNTSMLLEGTIGSSATTNYADCTLRFLGWGSSEWTTTDEVNLNTILKAFYLAIA
ncbi:hypothetical protein [Runella sp.]|uniref:hypothetical protein n=1 Tax=Runella sp. TaxID=1960881 RepID=UPI003D14E6BD